MSARNAYYNLHVTRPAEREQSQCVILGPKILTGALVRDTGTLRVSNIFPRTFWEVKMRNIKFKIFGDFF